MKSHGLKPTNEVYFDEKFRPVKDPKQATYKDVYTFDKDGYVTIKTLLLK